MTHLQYPSFTMIVDKHPQVICQHHAWLTMISVAISNAVLNFSASSSVKHPGLTDTLWLAVTFCAPPHLEELVFWTGSAQETMGVAGNGIFNSSKLLRETGNSNRSKGIGMMHHDFPHLRIEDPQKKCPHIRASQPFCSSSALWSRSASIFLALKVGSKRIPHLWSLGFLLPTCYTDNQH